MFPPAYDAVVQSFRCEPAGISGKTGGVCVFCSGRTKNHQPMNLFQFFMAKSLKVVVFTECWAQIRM